MGLLLRKTFPDGTQIALWHITETEDELSNLLSGRSDGDVPACVSPCGTGKMQTSAPDYGTEIPEETQRALGGVRSAALRRQRLATLALIGILFEGKYRLAHRTDGSPYLYIYCDADTRDARNETDNGDADTRNETDNGDAVPQISISHTGDYAAVMTCPQGPVGIDIELATRDFTAVGRKAVSAREAAGLDALPHGERNLRLGLIWCAKEAVYKKVGSEAADFAGRIETSVFPSSGGNEASAESEASVRVCDGDPLRKVTEIRACRTVENPAGEAGSGEGTETGGKMVALFKHESGRTQKLTLSYLIFSGIILVRTAD